jgi:large subunit ribosomal protein L2
MCKFKKSNSFLKSTSESFLVKKQQKLKKGFHRVNGRNHQGKITVRHRGGGHKRSYRFISFKRNDISGIVQKIDYDPNRSARIALIKTKQNLYTYVLAPDGLKEGTFIESGPESNISLGNALPLRNIPIGSFIHNISLKPEHGGQYMRSAGTSAQLIQKTNDQYAKIRLNSGQQAKISLDCYATLGTVSNIDHKKRNLKKAGRSRWLNRRPHVRGVAMNPVDHPHGGGEGKTSGGRPSVSPQGKITKGKPTRKKKKRNTYKI